MPDNSVTPSFPPNVRNDRPGSTLPATTRFGGGGKKSWKR